MIGTEVFLATAAGYRELLEWARGLGTVRRAGVEGTGSFGAALPRYLLAQGADVFDVNRPDPTDRRRRGKSDPLDAQNAARAVLSGRARAQAKSGDGPVQIARMYKLAKGSAVKARTQAINQLKAVLVSADPKLREELAGLNNAELFRICARLADDSKNDEDDEETVLQATRITLCLLAHRIGQLTDQIQDLEGRLALRFDPRTQGYYERRTKEGKTRREIVRCLKRYAEAPDSPVASTTADRMAESSTEAPPLSSTCSGTNKIVKRCGSVVTLRYLSACATSRGTGTRHRSRVCGRSRRSAVGESGLVPARGQPLHVRQSKRSARKCDATANASRGRQFAADSFPHGLRTGHVPLWSEHRIRRRPCSRPRNPRTGDQVRGIVRGQTMKNKLSASTPSRSWGGRAGGR
ncbi:transposase [Streptomyces inhibens]|uniref:IS110 family transposase n=1 Tax=Streptomyces inhibens TaxID=2293571 RepID=UPI0037AEACD4